ncbi:type VI secretion system-associated protein TagO [Orrella sp. 11846]|uniref:type VI secretion system-associated protein TagO n=1 Tax=Orrella sp. 11846 TaxID=3409913 RepID=UPI003B5CA65B
MKISTFLACISLFPVLVVANPLQKEVLSCSQISDGQQRLECFDRLGSDLQEKLNQDSGDEGVDYEPTPSNWRIDISKSEIDDSPFVTLLTNALEPISGRFRDSYKPVLILRCMQNTTAAFIVFNGHHMADIQGYGRVTFRVDKQKAFTQNTNASTDSKALGLWRGNRAIPFIKRLLDGKTLLVQATPFSESPITVTFDISGLNEAVKPLREACKW